MTKQTIWYETQLPNIVLDSIQPNSIPQQSTVYDDTGEKVINNKIRNSKVFRSILIIGFLVLFGIIYINQT